MASIQVIKVQDRQWLRKYRKLRGYDQERFGDACGISTVTYINVENGGSRQSKGIKVFCTDKTVASIVNTFGIKMDLFYYHTDDQGRLVDKSSIKDVLTLFSSQGYKAAVYNEDTVTDIFSPELAEYIITEILPYAN
jgi:transcriptional regulator with XRE-family HTH domain